jgi:O-antigen/teichoic acid export membrane protein
MEALKQQTIRGALAKLIGQGATFVLRLIFIVVLARLLSPSDFGIVAMVSAITGFYDLFRDGGLSAAAVQQVSVTEQQKSTLFWINMLIGALLMLICLPTAPVLVHFYDEPRLFWVTVATSVGFLFSAAGAQYAAILQRELRYVTLTVIDVLGVLISTVVGVSMAVFGFQYWSLVAAALVVPIVGTSLMWLLVPWRPGLPHWDGKIAHLIRYGGTLTLNNVVVYIAYNLDKVLLGRVWGPDALGLYTRACQLINIPTAQLNAAIGGVAFSSLSRLQEDPGRHKAYFLKGYSLVIALTAPVTLFCGAFADDIIHVVLGAKWMDAAPIFRLLTPTVLIFGIINPLSWLMMSIGLQRRSLNVALVLAPLCVASYVVGLPYGPEGVALAFSVTLSLWLLPHVMWCIGGTGVTLSDILFAVWPPIGSAVVASGISLVVRSMFSYFDSAIMRLSLNGCVMALLYGLMLLGVMGQRSFYLDLAAQLRRPRTQ